MKKISVIMITEILILLMNVSLFAQNKSEVNTTVIEPYRLSINFYKTTNLIFPYAIKSVDRGSKDILVQKANGVDNILQVKAGMLGFEQTNLTVITADGKLYSYILDYSDAPDTLNIKFDNSTEKYQTASFSNGNINEGQMRADAETVIREKKNIHGIRDKSYGIKVQVDGLFIKDEIMYWRIKLANNSNINYGIEQLRFYIRDQRRSRRTASQELEIHPLYAYGDTSVIIGSTEKVSVFALPKFTIPNKKYFAIELMEKNGGRELKLIIRNRTLIRANALL